MPAPSAIRSCVQPQLPISRQMSGRFQEGRADGARGAVPREDEHRKPMSPSFIAEHGVPWNIPVVSRGQLSAASPPGFLHTLASSRQGGVRRGRDLDTMRGLVSSSQHIGALISTGFHHKLKTEHQRSYWEEN